MSDWWNPLNWFSSSGGGGNASSMPAVGTETLTPQWQGYEAGAQGQPALNQAGNQGYMTGYSAGSAPWSAPTTSTTTPSFGDWLMSKEGASALQKTGESLKGPETTQAPKGSTINQAQMGGGSQVVRGDTQTLNQLMQLLNSRRYSPIGYSGGSSSGGSTRGLLGY